MKSQGNLFLSLITAMTLCFFSSNTFALTNTENEDLESEVAKALDKEDTSPLSERVIHKIKCEYLVLDYAASLMLLDEGEAQYTVMLQEALKNKVYKGSFSKLIEFWNNNKGPINILKLCPEYSDTIEALLEQN